MRERVVEGRRWMWILKKPTLTGEDRHKIDCIIPWKSVVTNVQSSSR